MIGFIDDHRVVHGVESICRVLPIAPSTYYACLVVRADPSKASARQQRDAVLRPKIQKVGMPTGRFTVSVKPGDSCAVKVKPWRAAPLLAS
jgi:hypothetical protein